MNLDYTFGGNKAEHIVAEYRVAAFAQPIVYTLYIVAYHQNITVVGAPIVVGHRLHHIFGGRHPGAFVGPCLYVEAHVCIHHLVDVERVVGYGAVEVGHGLVAHLPDGTRQHALVEFQLAVLKSALQHLAAQFA